MSGNSWAGKHKRELAIAAAVLGGGVAAAPLLAAGAGGTALLGALPEAAPLLPMAGTLGIGESAAAATGGSALLGTLPEAAALPQMAGTLGIGETAGATGGPEIWETAQASQGMGAPQLSFWDKYGEGIKTGANAFGKASQAAKELGVGKPPPPMDLHPPSGGAPQVQPAADAFAKMYAPVTTAPSPIASLLGGGVDDPRKRRLLALLAQQQGLA